MIRGLLFALVGPIGCAHSTQTVQVAQSPAASSPPAVIASSTPPKKGDNTPSTAAPVTSSDRAPDPQASGTTTSTEAVARAQAEPGTVFVLGGALYLSTRSGEAKLLDHEYDGDDSLAGTQLSADQGWVAFVKHAPESELWLASTQDGSARRLLTAQEHEEPQRNLTSFASPQFSPDGRTIYFLAEAWATSGAVHALDIHTLSERFVIDAVSALVIPSGPHVGELFVQRHQYKTFPGEGFHAFQWCGIVNPRGQIVRTLSEDESLCPGYAPGDRARIEAALRMPKGGPGLP